MKQIYYWSVCISKAIPFILALSTVLVVSHELSNGVVSGKYFWFYGSMGLVVAVRVLMNLRNRLEYRFLPVDALVLLFCLSGLLVTYINVYAVTTKFILLSFLFPLYICFRYYLAERQWNGYILILFLIITGLTEAIWGLGQLYNFFPSQHTQFRITGSFFNPGPYAGYLAVTAPLASYYLLADYPVLGKRRNIRYLPFYCRWMISALTITCILLVLPAAMSRASWIAVIGGCALSSCLCSWKRLKFFLQLRRKKFIIVLVPVLAVLIMLLSGAYFLKKDSADGRMLIWKISGRVIVEHPFGVGLGHFSGYYGEKQVAYFAAGEGSEQECQVAGNPEYGFNEYLQICIEWGIIPFIFFACLMGWTLYKGVSKRHPAAPALLALLIFSAMSYPFSVLPFVIVLVFLTSCCLTGNTTQSANEQKRSIATGWMLTVLLMVCSVCLYNRYTDYKAYKEWHYAKILADTEEYAALYPKLNQEIRFLFEYAQALNKNAQYAESNRILQQAMRISCDPMLDNIAGLNFQALKDYSAAEQHFLRATNMVPNRLYPYYLLAKLYDEMGLSAKACEMMEIVQTKEPRVNSTAVKEMREEMRTLNEKSNY